MKAKLATTAILAGMAGTAAAQSNVILYGVADMGIEYANHQPNGNHSTVRVQSSNMSGSRWGLRGAEELGGGNKAVFALEGGVSLDDGKSAQGGRLFGRQAWVGLQTRYGVLTLGRQTTPMFELGGAYDPMAIAGRYSIGAQDAALQSRADNSVKYVGRIGGLTAKGFYSFGVDGTSGVNGEVPGNSKVGREYSFALGYDAGPVSTNLVYDEVAGNSVATADSKSRRVAAAATYLWGPVKSFVGYRYARLMTPPTNATTNLYWAGATWDVSAAWNLTAVAYYQDFRDTGADPWMFVFSADYQLSKRTDLFLNVAYTRNKENSNLGVTGFGTTSPGANQSAAVLGIRHKF
ncbi:porin [Cupriavidus sp. SW-Y-13]|uniref:porin n=1 Tax=Cupriavidus sp. SW-Y-13 TaxID=2653854 RepID=UPI001365BE65|nr:porin [Cupriavidus sp. SW-Y-13]